MFLKWYYFRKKCQPRRKFKMADFFQDGRQTEPSLMKTTVKIIIQGRKLLYMFLRGYYFTQKRQPKQKIKMADFFQDGSHIEPIFQALHENQSKNNNRGLKICMHVCNWSLFQTKMLAKTKFQNGGFFQRWPPDQNRFSGFHESIVKMVAEG